MKFRDIKLGIAPINWCNDDMPELGKDISTNQCLEDMKASDFSGTEMGHRFSSDPVLLKDQLDFCQLELASAWHSTFFADGNRHKEQMDSLKQKLEFLKKMNAGCINLAECTRSIHGNIECQLIHKPELSDKEWNAFISGLTQASHLCLEYGIKPAYHHHMGTVIQSEEEIRFLLEETKHDGPGLCLDTGHLKYAEADSMSLLTSYFHRIHHIHFKDLRQGIFDKIQYQESFLNAVLQGVFTVPGDGLIDFDPVVKTLVTNQYKGWIIVEAEQDPKKAPPLEYAQKASAYLNELFNKYTRKGF